MGQDMIDREPDSYVGPASNTPMKVYLLTQDINTNPGAFSSCLVVAPSEVEARYIHPHQEDGNLYWSGDTWVSSVWVRLEDTHLVRVTGVCDANPNLGHVAGTVLLTASTHIPHTL
jgi:hypothetical protein